MQALKKYHVPLTITSFFLGLLLSVSFYTKGRIETSQPRSTELVEVVEKLQRDRIHLQKTLQSLRQEASQFERSAAAADGMFSDYTRQEEQYKKLSGVTKERGRGLAIVLADASTIPANGDPNDYIVHNTDLQAIVNALWNGGAKAVSVNDERLVGTSAIRCAGNTILVNSNLIGSPYRIKAIGNIEKMKSALFADETSNVFFKNNASDLGINVELREDSNIIIQPYKGGFGVEFAKILNEKDRKVDN